MRVLLAVVRLLALAAPAFAECAWVVWKFKERYWRTSDTLDSNWGILKVYDNRTEWSLCDSPATAMLRRPMQGCYTPGPGGARLMRGTGTCEGLYAQRR